MHDGAARTRYDGRQVYLPEVDKLRPGDILLTFNAEAETAKDLKQSKAIRAVTGGGFSHALICSTPPPAFVEAIGTGVSTLSLARCFAHDQTNLRLLRWPDQDIAREAARLAQDEIGRDYSVARAIRSVFPTRLLEKVDDHGIFCSALVAQVFAVAGASAFSATPVDRTTPATLERVPGLQDVTVSAFRRALAPRNVEAMSALDGARAPTPSAQQTRISADCARQLWPRMDAFAKEFPEMRLAPGSTFYGILRFVTDAMDRIDAVPPERRAAFTTGLMELDDALATWVERGELRRLLVEIDAQDGMTTAQTIRESFAPKPDIDESAMRSLLVAGEAELETRAGALARWAAWDPDRSRSLRAYLKIDEEALDVIRNRNAALREILDRLGVR